MTYSEIQAAMKLAIDGEDLDAALALITVENAEVVKSGVALDDKKDTYYDQLRATVPELAGATDEDLDAIFLQGYDAAQINFLLSGYGLSPDKPTEWPASV